MEFFPLYATIYPMLFGIILVMEDSIKSENSKTRFLKSQLQDIPQAPGVYKFKDESGIVIYVGKAKNLRHRVGSYFQDKNITLSKNQLSSVSKTSRLVKSINSIEIIQVKSEFEALVLEAFLIKEFKPFFNIVLKDDKSFLYIEILFKGELFPWLRLSRKNDLKQGSVFFGPFPSSESARFVFKTIRKFFPYRDCSATKFLTYSKRKKPCLYGDLGLCPSPCVGAIDSRKYKSIIRRIEKFLSGESLEITLELEKKMKLASRDHNYEEAAEYRDMLYKFNYVRERRIPATLYAQKPDLLQDLEHLAMNQLQNSLPNLKSSPERIECYDISNLGKTWVVGSMVVAINGKLQKSLYRQFKVKGNFTNDALRMSEILSRRLKRVLLKEKNWDLPNLLILDGGIPQLSSAKKVLEKMGLEEISLVGLTKKEEILVYFDGTKYTEIILPSDSEGRNLIIKLRDEAHRFAQSYHHKLRLTEISEIPPEA